MSLQEQALLDRAPETGATLLENIPRLRQVAQFVRYQAKGYDGSGRPADSLAGEDLPLGARILKVLNDFTNLEMRRKNREVALEEIALHREHYDSRVLTALYALFGTPAAAAVERACTVEELEEGMILVRNISTHGGRTVLLSGLRLGAAHLVLLRDLVSLLNLQEPVYVRQD